MQGLMQQGPLTLPMIFRRAEQLSADKLLATAGPRPADGPAVLERTTYGAWSARTRRLGAALDRLGIGPDGRVGTFAWNSTRHLELYFAVPCTGRVLHTLNIRLFADQLTYIVNHAEDEAIFTDRSLLQLLWPRVDGFETVRHIVVMDDGTGKVPDDPRIVDYEALLAAAEPIEFTIDDEDRAAAMCYTSGTTGNPKGVVYSHRSTVLHSIGTMLVDTLGVCERDVVLPVVPMFHANAWGLAHAAAFAGASIVFPGPDLSPQAIADLIERERVTLAAGVPTIWMGVLPLLEGRDVSSLTRIVCGGSAVPRALSEAYRHRIGLPILQAWGMTETSPLASVCRIRSNLAERPDEELADIRSTQGICVPGVEVRIAEPGSAMRIAEPGSAMRIAEPGSAMRIAEPGSAGALPWDGTSQGELQVSGPWIARDYYNDPRSGESFTKDGWLRTGDVATINPDGYIHLVDRTKDLIKSGGEWISSVELENELMAHPAVAEAAVIAIPDEKWQERPLACVVVKPGNAVTGDELREWLRPRVARWWLPDDVVFIDEVPKTSVGKFSKKDLRDQFAGYRASPGT